MSNNLTRIQNIFISTDLALPANNAASTAITAGQIAVLGQDMLALDPAGNDTITTQPVIYIAEGKTDSDGVAYLKRSFKIDGKNIVSYKGESYVPAQREVWAIGYNRKTAAGLITAANSTSYKYTIRFKNYKWVYSERPEVLTVNFTSAAAATQLTVATQIASAITSSAFKAQITAVVVGNGTGAYGLTGASAWGVEIWALDVSQNLTTTYSLNQVYFSVHVDDSTGFGTGTTCTEVQAFAQGSGTYNEVYVNENFDFGYEGILNRRQWPIPALDYSSVSTLSLSSAIAETSATVIGSDSVTFSATVAAKIRTGEKVEIDGVNYEIKYFVSTTVAKLTTVATTTNATGAVKVRLKYDLVTIEFNDRINTPTGVSAVSNKSVIIAVPAITVGSAYNSKSLAATDIQAVLNAWMTSAVGAFANISL